MGLSLPLYPSEIDQSAGMYGCPQLTSPFVCLKAHSSCYARFLSLQLLVYLTEGKVRRHATLGHTNMQTVLGVRRKRTFIFFEAEVEWSSLWIEVARLQYPPLYQHCLLVSHLAAQFSSYLGFSPEEQILLTKAAFLHDVGKTAIPVELLRKPAALDTEEVRLLHLHPELGRQMLVEEGGHHDYTLAVVSEHHERLDGSGYPRGLLAERISEPVRIVALCDVYAAMTERRPYASGLKYPDALKAMKLNKAGLDSSLVHKFSAMIDTILFTSQDR